MKALIQKKQEITGNINSSPDKHNKHGGLKHIIL